MYLHKQHRWFLCIVVLVGLALFSKAHAEDWSTFGNSIQRQGYNGQETVLTERTVPGLHPVWQYAMNGPILTQPLLASAIPHDDGAGNTVLTDLVYVADLTGLVAAFDAGGGGVLWASQLPALPTSCDDFPGGTVGVIGTPTIDKANNRMWVMAADGTLWALALDTGTPLPGYPIQVIDPGDANGATVNYGALTYDNGALYVPTAGQCDVPPYFGQLIKVSVGLTAATVPQVAARWYPTLATGVYGGGIWGFGGVSIEPDGSYLYAPVGNALTEPDNIGYADHVVQLNTNLQPVAANAPPLPEGGDVDFGATALLYQAPNCPPQMAVMNKTGDFFVYNRDSAALTAGPFQRITVTQTSDTGSFIGLPAYDPASNHLYLGNPKDDDAGMYSHGLLAFQVMADCTLSLAWQQTVGFDLSDMPYNPVIPPTVANSVVYYSTGVASSIVAFDSGGNYLWDSGTQIAGGIFAPPTIVNGLLLVADYSGNLTAFGP